MSGIAGIMQLKGQPIDRHLLVSMTRAMKQRGPDARQIWSGGHVGLGHAMLHTCIDTQATPQPCHLDGSIWITADARLDDRETLAALLEDGGQTPGRLPADVTLILAAYRRWGTDCVRHLKGDFSFAIWDDRRRIMFCARDHFGIKPFYYCRIGEIFLFSNSMKSLQLYPQVSSALNEQAVADLLLYGYSVHEEFSLFADICKLPPAHTLTVDGEGSVRCSRYWRLPVEAVRGIKRADDCIEEFDSVFSEAVKDRLRTNRVGILMSGGLDSTSVAAAANRCLADQFDRFDLRAVTLIYEWLIKDEETAFSRQVAETIGIPVHYLKLDAYGPDDVIGAIGAMQSLLEGSFHNPIDPGGASTSPEDCRVGLCGYGGDELFHPGFTGLKSWLQQMHLPMLAWETLKYWRLYGRLPAIGLRTNIRKTLSRNRTSGKPPYPPWLNRDFERRLNLRQQWQVAHRRQPPADTVRSAAVEGLQHPLWHNLFESFDPGMTGIPAELRFPYLDLRLVSFCLQLPPIPWCVDKMLLRRAGRQWLPESVAARPKAPLNGFPDHAQLLQAAKTAAPVTELPDEFEAYIDLSTYRKIARQPQKLRPEEHTLITYPLRLARWVQHMDINESKDKGRSPWQIPRKKKSTKKHITPLDCASMEISTV